MTRNRRETAYRKSMLVAFCGVAAGLSVVLMLAGGLLQVATFAAPLIASVLLLPVRVEFGPRAAWGTWLVSAALAVVLALDKELALFYLFIGWWPIVKWAFDARLKHRPPRMAAKILVFASAIAAMYALLLFVIGAPALTAELREFGMWTAAVFFGGILIALVLFDWLLVPLSFLYAQRVRPRLTFLRRR